MAYDKFSILLTIRIFLIITTLFAFSYFFSKDGFAATFTLLAIILSVQIYEVFKFVSRTNAELTRFLNAARYADFNQRFNFVSQGAGFEELGNTFKDILLKFQVISTKNEESLRHLKALIEHVPVPLITVSDNGLIKLNNNSARKLFGTIKISKIEDLNQFGDEFTFAITNLKPGERKLVTFKYEETNLQLSLSATELLLNSGKEKLISLQNIQSELDFAQLQAWQDLVRVLTHEIMNSITPVASLSNTTVDLVDDFSEKLKEKPEFKSDLEDVGDAVKTIAKRSDSLIKFVQSYRSLTRITPPEKTKLKIANLIKNVEKIATQGWADKNISLKVDVKPAELEVNADADMLEQILINLLKNAEEALEGREKAEVCINSRINNRGHLIIEVEDNGDGVPEDIANKMFVPFYTTKPQGSGVGLALARQIMIGHGGLLNYSTSSKGGAKFILTF